MDLAEQCRSWNADGQYDRVRDALDSLPDGARTPELAIELAWALCHLADPETADGAAMFDRVFDLLESLTDSLRDDFRWNFCAGFAYLRLESEGIALRCFRAALEVRPGDAETEALIARCVHAVSVPRFRHCFRERTEQTWSSFVRQEALLRSGLDELAASDADGTALPGSDEGILDRIAAALHPAFNSVVFTVYPTGRGWEKYRLVLRADWSPVSLYDRVYFASHAPRSVLEKWDISVGLPAGEAISVDLGDLEITEDDVQVWLKGADGNRITVWLYCEKLVPLIRQDPEQSARVLSSLLSQAVGDNSVCRYVSRSVMLLQPLDENPPEEALPLSRLARRWEELGMEVSCSAESCLSETVAYTGPQVDRPFPEADWRGDIVSGTCERIAEEAGRDALAVERIHVSGAFLFIRLQQGRRKALDALREEEAARLQDRLEQFLRENCGPDAVTPIGRATGLRYGYTDFIAWDIEAVLYRAGRFFRGLAVPWACYCAFRRDAETIFLKSPKGMKKPGKGKRRR